MSRHRVETMYRKRKNKVMSEVDCGKLTQQIRKLTKQLKKLNKNRRANREQIQKLNEELIILQSSYDRNCRYQKPHAPDFGGGH